MTIIQIIILPILCLPGLHTVNTYIFAGVNIRDFGKQRFPKGIICFSRCVNIHDFHASQKSWILPHREIYHVYSIRSKHYANYLGSSHGQYIEQWLLTCHTSLCFSSFECTVNPMKNYTNIHFTVTTEEFLFAFTHVFKKKKHRHKSHNTQTIPNYNTWHKCTCMVRWSRIFFKSFTFSSM